MENPSILFLSTFFFIWTCSCEYYFDHDDSLRNSARHPGGNETWSSGFDFERGVATGEHRAVDDSYFSSRAVDSGVVSGPAAVKLSSTDVGNEDPLGKDEVPRAGNGIDGGNSEPKSKVRDEVPSRNEESPDSSHLKNEAPRATSDIGSEVAKNNDGGAGADSQRSKNVSSLNFPPKELDGSVVPRTDIPDEGGTNELPQSVNFTGSLIKEGTTSVGRVRDFEVKGENSSLSDSNRRPSVDFSGIRGGLRASKESRVAEMSPPTNEVTGSVPKVEEVVLEGVKREERVGRGESSKKGSLKGRKNRRNRKRNDSKRKKSVIQANGGGLFDVPESSSTQTEVSFQNPQKESRKSRRRLKEDRDMVASSLAFVFDSTGSMWDDLTQVKQGAVKILETIREKNTTLIADYILVPFQDPVVGPMTVTKDHEEFLRRLREINVWSGGDCPEMTLSAIILALKACRPHSFVYVFTDARSKDYEKLNELLPLIQRKQTQVVFVMTGDCGDPMHAGYQVFEKIAATSSGQVYHLNKTDVQEVLNFVRVSLQSHKVNLLAVDRSNKTTSSQEEHDLPVDPTLKEFTVSVSGLHPKVQVIDPYGELPKNLTSLLDLENVKIVNVKQPDPGIWKLSVKSDAQYTIRSTGLSSIDFLYGFAVKPAKTLVETSHRPLKGTENSILIQTEPKNIQNLTTVCFLNVYGEILQNVTLRPLTPKKGVYGSEPFTPSGDYFYVSINGFSKNGSPLLRITPTAISPQLPAGPEIQPPSNYSSLVNQDVTLRCHVESLVPFSVRWFKDSKAIGTNTFYPQTADAEWKLLNVKSEDEGVYTCRANNAAGYAMQRIHLSVTGNPPFVITKEHVIGVPDGATILDCRVESPMYYNVTWYQGTTDKTRYWKEIKPNQKYTIRNNDQLIINPTFESDEGWYECIAQNSAGSGIGKLYLSVREEPKIAIKPESVKVSKDGSFSVKCILMKGTPKPKLLWRKDDQLINDGWRNRYTIEVDSNYLTLKVSNVQPTDSGLFTCHAVNDVNIITNQVFVEYVEIPTVQIEESLILTKEGDFVWMKCHTSGFPQPRVHWLKDGKKIEKNSNFVQVKDDLSILSVQVSDSGEYTCVAENVEGSNSASLSLQVGVPPQTNENSAESNISSVDVGEDFEFHCVVNGTPIPSIIWNREGNPLFSESGRFQISNDSEVLKIIETSLEDEGHYSCEAENIFGKTTLNFFLKITGTEIPKLEDSSEHENIIHTGLGEKVYLSCTLMSGKPKPAISWYHDEFPINSEQPRFQQHDNGSLTISKIEKFDRGTYVCLASNPVGSVKKVFKLQTYDPPRFEENAPSRYHAIAGENVTISCKIISDPKPTITWQKEGHALNNDSRLSMIEDSLMLQVRLEDKGTYICSAVNPAGSASRAVALDVSVKPVIIDNHDTNITLLEGEDYKIPCSAFGTPNPDIKWRRFDNTFSAGYHDEEIFVLADNSLILSGVTSKMSGTYECFAENRAGTASRVYTLTVNELEIPPPDKEEDSDVNVINMEVVESDVAELACPLPPVSPPEWLKDGTELNDLRNERADEAHFTLMDRQRIVRISESRVSDSGDYKCFVENNDLTADTAAIVRLNVVAPPTFEQEIHEPDVSVVEGDKLVLSCMVRGNPQPKVQWRFVDKDTPLTEYTFPGIYFEQPHKQNLVIPHANFSRHDGRFQCGATNKLGTQYRDFNVQVVKPPEVKESAVLENITANHQNIITLKCSISSHPKPDVTWLHNGSNISPKPKILFEKLNNHFSTYFLAINITDSAVGRYTCFASNKAGIAEKSFFVSLS